MPKIFVLVAPIRIGVLDRFQYNAALVIMDLLQLRASPAVPALLSVQRLSFHKATLVLDSLFG
jgi:hypothetical protein